MSPFSCQAKRDIKYFPSRARDGTGAETRALERGNTRRLTERGRDGERRTESAEVENRAFRERNGKPENGRHG